MKNQLLLAAVATALATTGFAQKGMAGAGNTSMVLVDPAGAGTYTTHSWGTGGSSRGHTYGWDGNVYRSAWTTNGIIRNDLPSTTMTTSISADSTNLIAGAPYQPAFDNNATGGPGILCVDGNPAPTPAPPAHRNWFAVDRVDMTGASAAVLGWFPTAGNIPMADCYRHPHDPALFVTVGFNTGDQKVQTWSRPSTAGLMTPSTVLTLANRCGYDAFIHEDQKLYCWTSTAAQTGFQVVDLKAGTQSFQAVTGLSFAGAGYAAVWNAPYEEPGRMAYVLQEGGAADAMFRVNLLTGAATAVTTAPPAGNYNTARSEGDAELSTWKMAGTTRRFHLNFGSSLAGDVYALFPSFAGYSSSALTFDGKELWVTLDSTSVAAFNNQLGAQTFAAFPNTSGEVDVDITLPAIGINLVWTAIKISGGRLVDVSNFQITRV